MNIGTISIPLEIESAELRTELDQLAVWAGLSPDRCQKVRDLFFEGGELRPGLLCIAQIPAPGTRKLLFRAHLSDECRELVAALIASHVDREIVDIRSHGGSC